MRAIQFDTEAEALQAWNDLEALCEPLHKQGTEKYTYTIGNVLILEPHDTYNQAVNEWIKGKELIEYAYPQNNEII